MVTSLTGVTGSQSLVRTREKKQMNRERSGVVRMLQHRDVLSCPSTVNQRDRAATFSSKALARNPRNGHLSASIEFYSTPLIELAVLYY
jgi:hypothetical protein